MSNYSFSHNLMIAWAAQVSLPQLGARLISFIETRAGISTFRLVAQYASSTAFRNLPEELVSMIASEVRDQSFHRNMKDWVQADDCLAGRCTFLSHISPAENRITGPTCICDVSQCTSNVYTFDKEAKEQHDKTMWKWCCDLVEMNGRTKIAKCVRAFTQEFGIRPYFILMKHYDNVRSSFEVDIPFEVDAKGYLIIPLTRSPIHTSCGDGANSFGVDSLLDLQMLTDLTDDQRRKFKAAATLLNLHSYDAKEDDSVYLAYDAKVAYDANGMLVCQDCEGAEMWSEDHSMSTDCADDGNGDKQQSVAGGQEAKQDNGPGKTELPAPSVLPSTSPLATQVKREKKELQPKLMMLGCGDF
ncbi:MAG: hypothetical protein Q9178_004824 [Gyalolechia marmorata]